MGERVLRRLTPDDWAVLRDVRLRALADSPDAFGSTLEREREFVEKDWRRRSVRPVHIVEVDGRPVAMAGVFSDDGVLQVWGMWTDPEHRGRGHARALLDSLVGRAVVEGRPVALHVNLANGSARSFYESYGFVATGELEPLRPGSDQRIERMRIPARPTAQTERETVVMTREVFSTTDAPAPVASYSQGCAAGDVLAIAGQVGVDPTGAVVQGGVAEQTDQALRNLDAVLRAAGASLADVVRMDCYLTSFDDFEAFNDVYGRWFPAPDPPTRTTVVVTLPPGLLVEVTALAIR